MRFVIHFYFHNFILGFRTQRSRKQGSTLLKAHHNMTYANGVLYLLMS